MDQIILIANKCHYQDFFSEFLYFPFFLSENSLNDVSSFAKCSNFFKVI